MRSLGRENNAQLLGELVQLVALPRGLALLRPLLLRLLLRRWLPARQTGGRRPTGSGRAARLGHVGLVRERPRSLRLCLRQRRAAPRRIDTLLRLRDFVFARELAGELFVGFELRELQTERMRVSERLRSDARHGRDRAVLRPRLA